jgi:hypothetical protein
VRLGGQTENLRNAALGVESGESPGQVRAVCRTADLSLVTRAIRAERMMSIRRRLAFVPEPAKAGLSDLSRPHRSFWG